jgi:hypothetical protein
MFRAVYHHPPPQCARGCSGVSRLEQAKRNIYIRVCDAGFRTSKGTRTKRTHAVTETCSLVSCTGLKTSVILGLPLNCLTRQRKGKTYCLLEFYFLFILFFLDLCLRRKISTINATSDRIWAECFNRHLESTEGRKINYDLR